MGADERRDFSDFVAARGPALQRTAFLLVGDWGKAEDVLQTVLVKTLRHWRRVRAGAPEAYVRAAIAREAISLGRRAWSAEAPTEVLPEQGSDQWARVDDRLALMDALRALPAGQRAVLVLRFYEDMTEEATAAALGVRVGTVKSQTSKALARLRAGATEHVETGHRP